MKLDNLDSPLRMTWDICPANHEHLTEDRLLQVADKLIDAGIFFLHLDERPLIHPGISPVLNRLLTAGVQVGLVLGDSEAEWDRLNELNVKLNLLLDAGCWLHKNNGLVLLESAIEELVSAGRSVSLHWVPEAGQLSYLHPLLEICKRQHIRRFKLPNRKIGANSEPVEAARLLHQNDLGELTKILSQHPIDIADIALEVHDLFLWELIFPQGGGERSEYGGCQAGNSLGHVAVNADVWPCSSWPQVLGNLLQQDLESIWESSVRLQVRTEVAAEPDDCGGCCDYSICYGGCRGLARSYRSDGGKRDLLCAGPR